MAAQARWHRVKAAQALEPPEPAGELVRDETTAEPTVDWEAFRGDLPGRFAAAVKK